MNKQELVREIASLTGQTQKKTDEMLGATINTIIEAVAEGEKVTLVGFGTFEAKERQARTGRNPKTGEAIQIPETKVPHFSAGKFFKEEVAQ
jgi:DNA-binding protein HU-beta